MDLVLDLELPVTVRFGTTRMRLGELSQLAAGSLIEFDRASENAVEVLVNDRVVARGEAVIVHGNYGIRITQVLADAASLDGEMTCFS
jgi:flagellar motor switch protein FliN/FliY